MFGMLDQAVQNLPSCEPVHSSFDGRRVLLLQGPVGPFFWNLAKDLRAQGAQVFKFNFNAGDWLFYPRGAERFTGALTEWPSELQRFVASYSIDTVLLFGDCRPVHAMVRSLGAQLGFAVGVFEEGYVRPDHVTFESVGVNGYSQFPGGLKHCIQHVNLLNQNERKKCVRLTLDEQTLNECPVGHEKVGSTYWSAACWGMSYFSAAWLGAFFWNNGLHHRKLSIADAPWWWLSYGRKQWYRWTERGTQEWLTGALRKKFFLVPLQVHNDAQVQVHSDFDSVCRFIDVVMRSFSAALKCEEPDVDHVKSIAECVLVFKHHPMDRGYRNYAKAIDRLTERYGLAGRVLYIHDQHLPSLLKACRGVVVVNSTTGLSALGRDAPVKVCGTALYDLPGLTYQGPLSDFWHAAPSSQPQAMLLSCFKRLLLERTQLNGSFYRKLPSSTSACGVRLDGHLEARLWPTRTGATSSDCSAFVANQQAASVLVHARERCGAEAVEIS